MKIRFPTISTSSPLLASYVALIIGTHHNYGFYTPFAFVAVVASFLCLLWAAATASQDRGTERHFPEWLAFLVLLLFLLLGARRLPGMYLQSQPYAVLYFYCTLLLIPLLTFAYLLPCKGRVRQWIFGVAILIAFAFRIAMPSASPKPIIDVFVVIQESAAHLLEGMNPYDTPTSDVYGNRPYSFLGYPYPPASLYPLVLGYALFGDIRYVYILSEAIFVAVLWYLARPRWKSEMTELLVLLFLFQPQSLFILEQSWNQPLILLFLSLALFFKERRRPLLAAASYGYMLSTKHELLFFVVHWFLIERRWRYLVFGIVVGGATLIPFLLWNPLLFIERAIWAALTASLPPGSLGIPTFIRHVGGPALGAWTGVAVGGVACVSTMFLFPKVQPSIRFLFASTITTFTIFLFGTHAYANNYYFVSALIIFLLTMYGGHREHSPPISGGTLAR